MEKQLKILVVDDTKLNLSLITKVVASEGHIAITAQNGEEAVEKYTSEAPDLILMDVMMPVMDGYQATAKIRELAGGKWIPVIFLSAKAQDQDQVMGLEVGGDDYLTKPVNLTLLKAKIKAMQRIAEMQRTISENAEQLARYREENEREQRLAQHLLAKIIHNEAINNPLIRHWLMPAANFSGDIIAVAATPGNVLHIILADGTGHGLSAAINAMPVTEVFYGMTEKGFSISSIAQELNRKVKQLLPTERFVAAVLVSIDLSQRAMRIWNGGAPEALFVGAEGQILRQWRPSHPPLGILDNEEFDAKTEVFYWHEAGQLILCSDGVAEAENEAREHFGSERIVQALSCTGFDQQFKCLKTAVKDFLGGSTGLDDISLIGIHCPMDFAGETVTQEHGDTDFNYHLSPGRWKIGIDLSASELKSLDVLPLLISWLGQLKLTQKQCREMFLIISELYNNALDHGVLGLDSCLKSLEDGFDRFLTQREERLNALLDASVEIELQRQHHEGAEYLQLRIKDSGKGFDATRVFACDLTTNTSFAGRGVALVRALCMKVEYLGNGNEVVALYPLN
jgi:CheY-like chemotaxis protein/anti-sigma regulatory factor (Ser/Thr protein kinase)